jgi:hypothetical protein
MITFNAERHEYADAESGAIIPSVTTILKDGGLIDDRWFSAEARDRGSAVHALCERYANGVRIDKLGRSLDALEYVIAFAAWMADFKPYAITTEATISHAINGKRYAGRFDGLYEIKGRRFLVDVKTGTKLPWHKAQLAAYSLGTLNSGEKVNPDACACLYLSANGEYKFVPYNALEILEGIKIFKQALEK